MKSGTIIAALILLLTFANVANVCAPRSSDIIVRSTGEIGSSPSHVILRGLSWNGLCFDPFGFKFNEQQFNLMVQQFPKSNVLVLPLLISSITPNYAKGDFSTGGSFSVLKLFVSLCKAEGIKVILSCYTQTTNENQLVGFWRTMASEFLPDDNVIAFDLLNEPWAFTYGNTGLPELYERLIDAIREIDSNKICCVQSFYYHHEFRTFEWIRTNPVARPNVVYIHHVYSNVWETGEWKTGSYYYPWTSKYKAHQYVEAQQLLNEYMYKRFAWVKIELKLPVWITEMSWNQSPEGQRYAADMLNLVEGWGISWMYAHYYSSEDRPMCLLDRDGVTLRPQAQIVNNYLNGNSQFD